jgi:aspartyl-tRNA(Asn)/glutamyl-tRNA(Gln) amidotransferase subunit A
MISVTPSVSQMATALAARQVSAVELAQEALARAQQSQIDLNGFISLDATLTLAEAEAADALRQADPAKRLAGVPIAHKDVFCSENWRTTAGSKMLHNFVAPYDATVVARLRAAGLVAIGKTNMDEFAMGSSNENSAYGPVHNPWHLEAVPGGSSGGSSAVVAAGIVPAATGTDTGGSIRQPAAFCGISGIKPTYGRVSRHGMIAFASSLDQGGVMARTAEDLGLLLSAIAGHDPRDSTSLPQGPEDFTRDLAMPLQGLRIGVPKQYFEAGLDADVGAAVLAALDQFVAAGAQRVSIELPHMSASVPAYYVIAPAEASSNLSRFDGVRYGFRASEAVDLTDLYKRSRSEGLGPEVKRRILVGTYVLSHGYFDAYYLQAQRVRRLIANDFTAAFKHCDVIAGPVAPTTAYDLGAKCDDPVAMYLGDLYTIPASLAGLPALSIPCGFDRAERPIGLQLIGRYFGESALLGIAHQYQNLTDWHQRVAPYALRLAAHAKGQPT